MAIRATRFPEYRFNLYHFTAPHDGEEAVRFFEGLGPDDATRWLTYLDPTVDMSGHKVATLPKLKRVIGEKQKEIFDGPPAPRVLVCGSQAAEEFFLRFWSGYLGKGEMHPVSPAIVSNLEAAYDRLELPEAARTAVALAIEDNAKRSLEEISGQAPSTASPG